MALGSHAAFIVAAYLITAIVVLGLTVWVIVDRRAQARALADLDARGVRRRSEPARARTA
ncbi:MAG: heme exporter protein CcmD [Rhizobiales bacterium]|nr:heme exporter protein CcmD [Hyphomicrobiales bacterium]